MEPPAVGVAVNVMLVPGQIAPVGLTVMDTAGEGIGFTVIVITFEVAFGVLAQPELLIIRTLTWSPFASVVLVNVVAVVLAAPWLVDPMNHSNVGAEPPLPSTAVNVTLVPAQIAPDGDDVMLTAGVTTVVTVITTAFEVAVVGFAHVAVLVITTS